MKCSKCGKEGQTEKDKPDCKCNAPIIAEISAKAKGQGGMKHGIC